MNRQKNQPQMSLASLLPLAERSESQLLAGAFQGLRMAWRTPCPEGRVAVLDRCALGDDAWPQALVGNGAAVLVLTRKSSGTSVAPLGQPPILELPGFCLNSSSACLHGPKLIITDYAESRIAIVHTEERGISIHAIRVRGLTNTTLHLCGICVGPGALYITATDGTRSHVLRLVTQPNFPEAEAELVHTTRTAVAIRYFNNRFHMLAYHPVPMLTVCQADAKGMLRDLAHVALEGYPVDILPFGDGFLVAGYGSLLHYGPDYAPRARYDLPHNLELPLGSYVMAAPANADRPDHIWLCASQRRAAFKLALS